MSTLGVKLEEYWKAIRHKKGIDSTLPMEDMLNCPDQNWVQCDECLKWRKLPDGIDMNKLPDKWFCRMNPDPQFRRCEENEEAEDSADEASTCLKTYKEYERNLKKQQEQKKLKAEDMRLRQEQQKNAELIKQNENLKSLVRTSLAHSSLVRQLHHNPPSSPRSPTVSWQAMTPHDSQSASSPSDNMPVISNVCSLSTPKRLKRTLSLSQSQTAKRPRPHDDYSINTPECPSTSAAGSDVRTSPSGIANNNVSINNESSEDDDIVIDEIHSTPRPKPSTFDLSKVKTEENNSDNAIGLFMECSDQASVDTETEDTRKGPSTSEGQTSTTTQTECLIIKKEEDQKMQKEETEIKKEEIKNDARAIKQSPGEVEGGTIKESMEVKTCSSSEVFRINLEGIPKENTLSLEQQTKSDVENQGGRPSSSTSFFPNVEINLLPTTEAQKQQDNLLEILDATAQERDKFKEQVLEKEIQLLKLSMKKDHSHQSVQTDPSEDFRTLYLQANKSIQKLTEERDELKMKVEALLKGKAEEEACHERLKAESEGHSSTVNADDEMALQVDFFLRELDTRNTECQELRCKLESLEQEKASYVQLEKEVEELRKQREQWSNANVNKNTVDSNSSATQTCSTSTAAVLVNGIKNDGESTERLAEGQNTGTPARLRELRCNVARLLVNFVPALDLDQVNYDCEVIDEILNQVIQEISPSETGFT